MLLLRVGAVLLGVGAIVGSGFMVRYRSAVSRLAQQEARQNVIFGRRRAEENAQKQTPAFMIFYALIVFGWGIALVYIGVTRGG